MITPTRLCKIGQAFRAYKLLISNYLQEREASEPGLYRLKAMQTEMTFIYKGGQEA